MVVPRYSQCTLCSRLRSLVKCLACSPEDIATGVPDLVSSAGTSAPSCLLHPQSRTNYSWRMDKNSVYMYLPPATPVDLM